MTLGKRVLTRVGVAALLIAGGLAVGGAPAQASGEPADLELAVVGLKLAAGAPGKIGWAKVTNHGPGIPSALTVTADLSGFDVEQRGVALPFADDCEADEATLKVTCVVPDEAIPGVGETVEVPVFVIKNMEAKGSYQAPVTFTIASPGDTNPDNNSKKVEVVFGQENGVDLGVLVPDIKGRVTTFDGPSAGPLYPGDSSLLLGMVFNWGDTVAKGLKVNISLPRGVTFAETESGCTYGAGRSKAVCTYPDLVLPPAFGGTGMSAKAAAGDDLVAAILFPVTVDAGVAAPVTLADGTVTVEAIGQLPVDSPQARAANRNLPKNIRMVTLESVTGAHEVDKTDNSDNFAVIVQGDGNGGDGGGGGTGGLPVTGAQAGLIGGIGLAVLVTGGVLLMLARRRRVVLVTPGDETPTS